MLFEKTGGEGVGNENDTGAETGEGTGNNEASDNGTNEGEANGNEDGADAGVGTGEESNSENGNGAEVKPDAGITENENNVIPDNGTNEGEANGNGDGTDAGVGTGEESNNDNDTGDKTTVGTATDQETENGNGDITGTETGTGEIENENSGNCNYCPEPYGEFPHPSECRKWVHCSHGIPYIKDCPSDLHFNPKLRVCDYQDRAGCVPSGIVCNPPNVFRKFIRL